MADWESLSSTKALVVDVRDAEEFAAGHIPGAINLPLPQLRSRLNELPLDREIWVNCVVGQRAYYALRLLRQRGFTVKNLSGGITTYRQIERRLSAAAGASSSAK